MADIDTRLSNLTTLVERLADSISSRRGDRTEGETPTRDSSLESVSNTYLDDRLKKLKEERELYDQFKGLFEDRSERLKRNNALLDNELQKTETQIEQFKRATGAKEEALKRELLDYYDINKELLKGNQLSDTDLNNKEKLIQATTILKNLEQEKNQYAQQAGDKTKQIISAGTGVSDNWKGTLVGSLIMGGDKAIANAGAAITDTFSSANILGSLLMKVQESTIMMVKQADTTFATFNKTIGTTGELNSEIMQLSTTNAGLGFTLDETARSYTALASGFVDFRGLSQQNRTELAQTVAELQAIGISADLATKNISFFSKSMGLSTEQSISLSKELVATAGVLEMAPSKIASDFAAASSSMVVYGNRAVEVFKGLESAAKASGVEVNNLISVASKMDTFQGAAEAAGKLNAVLGGGLLNSSELLMASEEQRIRLVVEAVQSQGVQFNELDKYTQKTIASAAGITDMAEANKLFGMSLDAYDDYVSKTAMSSEEQANLEERINASKSAQEKFNYIIQSFAVLVMPILDAITALIDGFMSLNEITGGMLPQLLTLGATGYAIFSNWAAISMSLAEAFSAIFTFVIEGGLVTLGTIFSEIIIPIMAVVGALYLVYKAFFDGKNAVTDFLDKYEFFRFALYFIATPIFIIIGAFKILGSTLSLLYEYVLTPIGHFFMWFGGLLLDLVAWFNPLFKAINDGFGSLLKILHLKNSPALYEMADYLAAGFSRFATVLSTLVRPALDALLAPLKAVGSLMSGAFHAIESIFGSTSTLFDGENVVGIKANVESTAQLAKASASVTPDSMKNVKMLTDEVQKFNVELKTMAVVAASAPLMELVKAISGQTAAVTDTNKDKTIVLKVGEREFGKVVLDTINRKGNLDTAVKSTSTNT